MELSENVERRCIKLTEWKEAQNGSAQTQVTLGKAKETKAAKSSKLF